MTDAERTRDITVRLSRGVVALGIEDAIPTLATRHASDVAESPGLTSAFRLDGRDVLYMFTREGVVFVCLDTEWREMGRRPWAAETPWPGDN